VTAAPDGIPAAHTAAVPDSVEAVITVTARLEGRGLLVSLKSEGDFSSGTIDRRFYSIPSLPPADLDPAIFWASILGGISVYLSGDDED
jgi:hypothetical protein